jgi:hypothetical protein
VWSPHPRSKGSASSSVASFTRDAPTAARGSRSGLRVSGARSCELQARAPRPNHRQRQRLGGIEVRERDTDPRVERRFQTLQALYESGDVRKIPRLGRAAQRFTISNRAGGASRPHAPHDVVRMSSLTETPFKCQVEALDPCSLGEGGLGAAPGSAPAARLLRNHVGFILTGSGRAGQAGRRTVRPAAVHTARFPARTTTAIVTKPWRA